MTVIDEDTLYLEAFVKHAQIMFEGMDNKDPVKHKDLRERYLAAMMDMDERGANYLTARCGKEVGERMRILMMENWKAMGI